MINEAMRKKPEVSQPAEKPDFTIDQLEAMIEAKRVELGKGIKQSEAQVLPPGKAPQGFIWVYNRGVKEFEWQFNSAVYKIDGHTFGLFPIDIAEHGRRRSLLTLNPVTNQTTAQLALPDDVKIYGRPMIEKKRYELIDRSSSDDPAELGRGEKTHIAVIDVEGGDVLTSARPGAFAELA